MYEMTVNMQLAVVFHHSPCIIIIIIIIIIILYIYKVALNVYMSLGERNKSIIIILLRDESGR